MIDAHTRCRYFACERLRSTYSGAFWFCGMAFIKKEDMERGDDALAVLYVELQTARGKITSFYSRRIFCF